MRKEKWLVQGKKANFNELAEIYGISPIITRIIRNRDYVEKEEYQRYLYGGAKDLYDPFLMKDMESAVSIVMEKIRQGKKIRVIGDYDIDGVCSTYLLVDGLKQVGADVSMDIPDRVKDGYGINETLIQRAYEAGVDTILTCDNGIAAVEQIAYAKSFGITVIVTDHHELPYVEENGEKTYLRVPADAVINNKQPECGYPFKLLCGAAVAYKFLQALYGRMGRIPTDSSVILEKYIEFAAIATIGDVVDLKDENRILVKLGMERLRHTNNPGLQALIEENGLEAGSLTSYHIGFVLGPCLNAGGRLETAKLAFALLNEKDHAKAKEYARHLKQLNDKRKELTEQGVELAMKQAEDCLEDKFLVLYLPEVHESIAGIIAGRVREKLNKPVVVLTKAEEGVKGSGRSIEGCNMFEELTACRHLLEKFGGHEMAAGLSLKEENIERLRIQLNKNTKLTEEDLIPKIWIDVPMPFEYVTGSLMEQLKLLEPFGKGNEKPVFAEKNLGIDRFLVIGKNKDSLKLTLTNERGLHMTALLFRGGPEFLEDIRSHFGEEETRKMQMGIPNKVRISVIYYPQTNEYKGRVENQVIIQNYCF